MTPHARYALAVAVPAALFALSSAAAVAIYRHKGARS